MRTISSAAAMTVAMTLVALAIWGAAPARADAKQVDDPPEIVWRDWSAALFATARRQKRFVLLDLNARWCHWCHFMDRRTYAHPDVRRLVAEGYLAVKVDQDANPDLASRYGDWGWPATIIFDPDGNEVAKLQGFQRPSLMATILHTILRHPERVPKLPPARGIGRSSSAFLSEAQRQRILKLLDETYDVEHAGWGRRLKLLRPDVIEYALEAARRGDASLRRRVLATLDAARALIDREWGGIYQYSHERDWSAPHYEKIMWSQAQSLRLYARAHALTGEARFLEAARDVYRYLTARLSSPEGAFYTSQDADVDGELLGADFYGLTAEARARLGKAPPIDRNLYARENGWAISGILALHNVTGDGSILARAVRAAEWVLANRSLAGGGFRHGATDRGGPYLSDTLAVARAMPDLYTATGDARWLSRAARAGDFIAASFKHPTAGFVTTRTPAARDGVFLEPYLDIEENIRLARFANLMHRTLGKPRFRDMAVHAMRYLTSDAVTSERRFLLGIVLADEELGIEPTHITVVGPKRDADAAALHRAARRLPIAYLRVDWWDPAEGPMPNPDVTYPELERPAAFACANRICSLPVLDPAKLSTAVDRMSRSRVVRRAER